ncbi:CinA family protein [Halopseudomonas sp.]|uniref:CinA family protein n=1 Tax=Halopseudomonas sp. TaxID=2901191 RepID=UPI0035683296
MQQKTAPAAQNIKEVLDFLRGKQLLLATAESCTAGLMAGRFADVSGSGAALEIGFVVYSPQAKMDCLGVKAATIDAYGLASMEVAREMALGALRRSRADIVLANTGMAESDGELDGLICFTCAMRVNGQPHAVGESVRFDGSRNEVRDAGAMHGLLNLPHYYQRLLAGTD